MPTYGPDLGLLTVSQLSAVSGVTEKTCIKRLRAAGIEPVARDGRALYFAPAAALRAIFAVGDAAAAKSRLDTARAALAEHELRRKNGEVIPVADNQRTLIALATMVSGRLQGVPTKIAQELAAESSPAGCLAIVEREVLEALEDLAAAGEQALKHASRAKRSTRASKANGGTQDAEPGPDEDRGSGEGEGAA